MNLPRITIIKESVKDNMNLICEAMGLGTPYFTRKLCAINPLADHTTPPTHYLAQDMSAQDHEAVVWIAMAVEADLPAIQGIWGENDIISAQDAQETLTPGNLQVYTAGGLDQSTGAAATAWRDGILLGAGLQFVPDEPI